VCTVFKFHTLFNSGEREELERTCRAAKVGCVACKRRLADVLVERMRPLYEKRKHYEDNPGLVREILADGASRARAVARETLAEVREAMKIL